MKPNYLKLITYLLENNQVQTSQKIADALDISMRSVKSYILQINRISNSKVVISSKNGYTINRALAHAFLDKENLPTPQNFNERSNYIIKQFIVMHTNTVNIYDLCESLFISDSTLKSDIKRINNVYSQYQIKLKIEKDNLILEGTERSIRKLFSLIIYDDVGSHYTDLNVIKDDFESFDVRVLEPIIKTTFAMFNYYVNDIALNNFIIHIAIIVERLIEGKSINEYAAAYTQDQENHPISEELCNQLEKRFCIKIIEQERNEIDILIKTYANLTVTNSINELSDFVGKEIMDLTYELIEMLESNYKIKFANNSFVIPFALHLKNLLYRAKNNRNMSNPMTETIVYNHPIVYDMALSVAMLLIDRYGIKVGKSETAFIALHIGGEIERQRKNLTKVRVVLLCPNYMNVATRLNNSLLLSFSNDISIIATVSSIDALKDLRFNLLISTIKVPDSQDYLNVIVPPFSSQIDKVAIQEKIEECKNNVKNKILKQRFDITFANNLSFFNPKGINTSEKAIKLLCENLCNLDYAPEDYYDDVMSRENAASTAFNGIAIPHSIKMDCYKTCVSVLITKKGIPWNKQNIRVVLLIAISQYAIQEFSQLYEALVVLFSDNKNIEMFSSCRSFEEFKETLFSLIN